MVNLQTYYKNKLYEAGCDEAGRGPLAGPVYAAAVILNPDIPITGLNDSKLLTENERNDLRKEIQEKALAWSVCSQSERDIDKYNILYASLKAMRAAILKLAIQPKIILVDGNKTIPHLDIEQYCMIKGDSRFQSIAAASILAKTYRDEYMMKIHKQFSCYGWDVNKGYPTFKHRQAIQQYGLCKYHRKTFHIKLPEPELGL